MPELVRQLASLTTPAALPSDDGLQLSLTFPSSTDPRPSLYAPSPLDLPATRRSELAADGSALSCDAALNGYAPATLAQLVDHNARWANTLDAPADGAAAHAVAPDDLPQVRMRFYPYRIPSLWPSVADARVVIVMTAVTQGGRLVLGREAEGAPLDLAAGHREPGEDAVAAAEREFVEETGALDYRFVPLAYYSIAQPGDGTNDPGAYGLVCRAEVRRFGALRHEIAECIFLDAPPADSDLRHGRLAGPLLRFALAQPWDGDGADAGASVNT